MASQSYRIFVGNLPHEVTRDQIVSKFKQYGNVESVEIKTKKDTTDQVIATFSYVNLNTDKPSLDQCILLLNGVKWGPRHLKVEVAKESFLQRLQRERQSANKQTAPEKVSVFSHSTKEEKGTPSKVSPAKDSKIFKKKTIIKRAQSSSESSDSEDENGSYHPTSKLPMFKGISSFKPAEPQPVPQRVVKIEKPEHDVRKERTISKHEVKREKPVQIESKVTAFSKGHSYKKSLEPGQSTDILKKFESFSDVWKDDDEETYPSKSKYTSKLEKQSATEFKINQSIRNNWQDPSQSVKIENVGTNVAEEKRLKSIEEKRQAFEQQKKAVQQALSDKNAPKSNKKIVFDDDGDDDSETVVPVKKPRVDSGERVTQNFEAKKSKALTLFDDSDDEETANWSGEFQVKKQFEGHKGKKLLELQNKYNNDQRFKLDERFYESDEESKSKPDTKTEEPETVVEGLAEEREQQLQILSGILGKPISVSLPPSHNESKKQGMLRFDPLKPNHSRYELIKEPQEGKKKKKSKQQKKTEDEDEDEDNDENDETVNPKVRREEKDPEPVSQSKFYSVSDTLADSLKLAKEGQSSGFSLLQMFGSSNTSTETKEKYTEVITKPQGLKKGFNLDDSSSEDEDTEQQGPTAVVNSSAFQSTNKSNSGVRSTGGVWQESFFFQPNDDRLKEGADFFSQIDSSDPALFSKKREALKRIVKLKMKKNNRKANSFTKKVGTLRKKANLWPKSNNVQRTRKRQRH